MLIYLCWKCTEVFMTKELHQEKKPLRRQPLTFYEKDTWLQLSPVEHRWDTAVRCWLPLITSPRSCYLCLHTITDTTMWALDRYISNARVLLLTGRLLHWRWVLAGSFAPVHLPAAQLHVLRAHSAIPVPMSLVWLFASYVPGQTQLYIPHMMT